MSDTDLIQASIEHWERMRDNRDCGEQPFTDDCPLCQRYFNSGPDFCHNCPIFRLTGMTSCKGTPYSKARAAWEFHPAEWPARAQDEINFLKLLLPVNKDTNT